MKIQGIKKYCDKEAYIIEILKNKKQIFKDIIGREIMEIHTEVRLNKNKSRVDLLCEVEDGSLTFVEVSIRYNCIKDFVTHRNQLINILKSIKKDSFTQIILISPDFLNEDIREIEKLIESYNIKIYFVYLSMGLIMRLHDHIYDNLNDKGKLIYNKSVIDKCITVTSRNVDTDKIFKFDINKEECGNDTSKAILRGLREELYWHLAVHRYKDLTRNIIRIGTGTSDIILNINCNMVDKIRIEVDFAKRFNIFNVFKDYMADMSNEIEESIDIDCNSAKIFTEILILKNEKVSIDRTIDIAKRYMEYITKMYKIIKI